MINKEQTPSKTKILLVEDDPSLGFVIKDTLSQNNFDVTLCADGEQGAKTFTEHNFQLCILDVMLPKKDGFSLAKTIRSSNKEVPIIFLTAKSMTEDKLEGFRTGADDYITKPFSLEELLCRIEVFLKRSNVNPSTQDKVFSIGQFQFDYRNLTLKTNNAEKILTQKEAEVLRLLHIHRGRVLKREEILTHVWGDDDYFMGRSMDVFISKLRKYLREDPAIQIVNYHGVGFKLEEKVN
jgi:DNA-binding response OmpR family regulator